MFYFAIQRYRPYHLWPKKGSYFLYFHWYIFISAIGDIWEKSNFKKEKLMRIIVEGDQKEKAFLF